MPLGLSSALEEIYTCSCSCGQVVFVFVLQTPTHTSAFLYFMVGFSKLPSRTFQKYSHYSDGGGVKVSDGWRVWYQTPKVYVPL